MRVEKLFCDFSRGIVQTVNKESLCPTNTRIE